MNLQVKLKCMKELINLTNPNFPCFDLTFWNSLDIDNCLEMDDVLIADDQYYAKSEHINKYLLNHIVVDSDGKKFRAIKVLPFASWRKLLPFTAKAKVEYESLETSLSVDELRSIILKKLDAAQDQEEQLELRAEIMKAKDYRELFGF